MSDRYWRYLCLGCAAGTLVVHVLCLLYEPYLNHDVAQYLSAGRRIVDGAVPLVGLIDTNPPAIMYLSAVPAALAQLGGLPLATSGLVFFFLLMLLAGGLFVRTMALGLEIDDSEKCLAWIFWLWLSLWVYRTGDFGQRDHLVFMFLIPFVLLRYARYAGHGASTWLSSGIAVLAFAALAMKPFYAAALVASEAAFIMRNRSRCAANLRVAELGVLSLLAGACLLYFLLAPGIDAVFSRWLAFISKGYSAYSAGALYILKRFLSQNYNYLWLLVLFLSAGGMWAGRNGRGALVSGVSWFGLASFLIYLYQRKGWEYQLLPFFLSAFTVTALWCVIAMRRILHDARRQVHAGVAVFMLLTGAPTLLNLGYAAFKSPALSYRLPDTARIIRALTAPHETVMLFDTGVPSAYPSLTYADRSPAGRFLCFYPLAFIFSGSENYAVPAAWKDDEEAIYRMIVEDAGKQKPRLVFMRAAPGAQGVPEYFVVSEYFRRKGFFEAVLQDYANIGRTGSFDVYLHAAGPPPPADVLRSLRERGLLKPPA